MKTFRVLRDQYGAIWGIGDTDDEAHADMMENSPHMAQCAIVKVSNPAFRTVGACPTVLAYMDVSFDEAERLGIRRQTIERKNMTIAERFFGDGKAHSAPANEPVRTGRSSPLVDVLDKLDGDLNELAHLLADVTSRMEIALLPSTPTTDNNKDMAPQSSPLVERLMRMDDQVQDMYAFVVALRERLTL